MGAVGSRMESNCSVACDVNKTLRVFSSLFGKKMACNSSGPITVMCNLLPAGQGNYCKPSLRCFALLLPE